MKDVFLPHKNIFLIMTNNLRLRLLALFAVVIPDFTPEQLIGYELRVSNERHEDNMNEEKLSAEDLGLIMTFLNYKKRNIAPVKKR